MNARQKKKQFKKKYGVNPKLAMDILNSDAVQVAIARTADVLVQWCEGLADILKAAVEMKEGVSDEQTKEDYAECER